MMDFGGTQGNILTYGKKISVSKVQLVLKSLEELFRVLVNLI